MSKKIKILITDIDGILSSGQKIYDKDGNCIGKSFCDRDFTAIKRFRAIGIPVVAITGDEWNAGFLHKRNIPYYVNRNNGKHICKTTFLPEILENYNVSIEEVAYIGDDLFDIPMMRAVGQENAFCPDESPKIVRFFCNQKFYPFAGADCLSSLFDALESLDRIPRVSFDEVFPKILSLDEHEKF